MADAKFDAVIVGAGHNGLALACHLAKAGWSVCVCERRHEDGGGANTEEATVPGFHHNMHAQYMEFIDYMPVYHDFNLEALGARMIKPEAQMGITFADGRPPIVIWLPEPEFEERTRQSIARYSKHDADTWVTLKRVVHENQNLFAQFLYSPGPDLPENGDETRNMFAMVDLWVNKMGLPMHWMTHTPKVIIDNLWESTEMRALLYRQCIEWGANVHTANGIGWLLCVMWLSAMHYMSVGGTHTLAHAMANAAMMQGTTIAFNSRVAKINLKGNRATGVTLQDGRVIEADKCVISNADPKQTFIDLVGMENLSEMMKERLSHIRSGPEHVLGTPAFALHEAPDYKSARWDPTINKCFYTVVGYETAEQASDYILEAYGGQVPRRPAAGTWVNSLWDPTQAPPGKHAMNGWFFFPRASCLTPAEWDEVRATYNEKFRTLWEQYAPNMTRANVIRDRLYTAFDMERKMAMPEGDFSHARSGAYGTAGRRVWNYRTDIDGLYLCGSYSSGGGVSAAGGYNAFKVICHDYNLPPIWKQPTRTW